MSESNYNSEESIIILPFDVDVPLKAFYEQSTGQLVIDSPTIQVGNSRSASILRLKFSPAAARSLLVALRSIEEKIETKIGADGTQGVQ